MNTISFMTANYVARQTGYHITEGWKQGDTTTQDYFRPIETFGERFETLLTDIIAMGFSSLDLWLAHLHPSWATGAHVEIARDLLRKHHLQVTSLAGWFGSTREELERSCQLAVGLGATILGGNTALVTSDVADRAFLVDRLRWYDLTLGIENHPEKSPDEVLAKIGDGAGGRIGTALDTGWFATQGYDAPTSIKDLAGHIVLLHLKDVLKAGMPHETCRYGQGVAKIAECVAEVKVLGYAGAITVEHEPEHADPTEDCIVSVGMLRGWLGA
jgi:sugar phosphate isomerase/epimerase